MRRSCERHGEGADSGSGERRMFNQFISNIELEDVAVVGNGFTWYRPNDRSKSIIDRVLVLKEWFNR